LRPNVAFGFLTGSQNLCGDETLKQVAEQSIEVVRQLSDGVESDVDIIWKPTLRTSDEINKYFDRYKAGLSAVRKALEEVI